MRSRGIHRAVKLPFAFALALSALLASAASAQTGESTPTPTPTPAPASSPEPTPTEAPAATATPEATPAASPSPAATATPVATQAPAAESGNPYREGLVGSAPGPHPLRAFAGASVHLFMGEGWNEESTVPGEAPPKSEDYLGGGIHVGALWEFTPSIAAVGRAGGHQGRHALGEDAEPEPVTISYGLYYLGGGARWQTRPSAVGAYVEAGGGFAMGRVIVTRPDATDDAAEHESFPTFMGYGALGATMYVGRGIDVFVEGRFMTAPHGADSFTSDHELDLGGVAGSAGISLRL